MFENNFISALTVLFTQLFLGSYVLMLTDFKRPARKWRLVWTSAVVVIVGASITAIALSDFYKVYPRVGVLAVTLPYILITLICSRHKGLRVVFNICTCLWLGCIGQANGALIQTVLPKTVFLPSMVRVASYVVLYFVVRAFMPYYRRMLRLLDKGWGTLCIIPFSAFVLTVFLSNNVANNSPVEATVIIYGIVAVCTGSYVLIYFFFIRVLQEYDLKNSYKLINAQISELERQSRSGLRIDETLRIQRHDMRHQWLTAAALIEQGDNRAVAEYARKVLKQLEEDPPPHWKIQRPDNRPAPGRRMTRKSR